MIHLYTAAAVSLEFVDWFYQSLMLSLFPGACFQRRRTCLDIIQSWLEIFIFVESDAAKKGKAKGEGILYFLKTITKASTYLKKNDRTICTVI